jgi:hypothetical protein
LIGLSVDSLTASAIILLHSGRNVQECDATGA